MNAIDQKSPESRTFVRLPVKLGISMSFIGKINGTETEHKLLGHIDNISDEGICIRVKNLTPDVEEVLSKGENILDIGFQIPMPDLRVAAKGKVVWIRQKGSKKFLGVQLINLDEETQKKIFHYILNEIVKDNLEQ